MSIYTSTGHNLSSSGLQRSKCHCLPCNHKKIGLLYFTSISLILYKKAFLIEIFNFDIK